ncbi:alpha/beta fold hydrolase [Mycolicibacterium bacteremicum]|uniref:alpha/beta fold hydrolase n=1 Tax=Mycolicibacterium bacteremicum TaxID=564198 RepID=UPI0026EAC9AB|nr:alpha/beta hydrolase [Mycolicibacterium bacteremicum]
MSNARGFHRQYYVQTSSGEVAVFATDEPSRRRPVAVLLHGTAYLAQVWSAVLPALADTYTVLAIDRRGHGASAKPEQGYDFEDFADDLVAVIDHFDIRGGFGIGHSAGGTDVLLAAARRPDAFSRLFVVEPTAMLPGDDDAAEMPLGELSRGALEKIRGRRNSFTDAQNALARLRRVPAFAGWQEPLLAAFIEHGLEPDGDGVKLRCAPAVEARMLTPIFRVMETSYRRSAIFAALADITVPVCIARCEHSGFLYPPMADAVQKLIPAATEHTFTTGHCVAQQEPHEFAAAVLAFGQN